MTEKQGIVSTWIVLASAVVFAGCSGGSSGGGGGGGPVVAAGGPAVMWSDAGTWGGSKPVADQVVTIPANTHVVLDEDPPRLGGLVIEGTLEFARQDLNLRAGYVLVMGGTLRIGTEAVPFAERATITLDADDPTASVMNMGTRGLMVMGGTLELVGTPPAVAWTRLNAPASAGATQLTLDQGVDWQVGDQVAVAPTDFYQVAETQQLTLAAVGSTSLTTQEPLTASRWGRLQYLSASGLSLDPADELSLTGDLSGTPTVLDERAEVGNLTATLEGLLTDADSVVLGIQMGVTLPTNVATTVRAIRPNPGLQVNYTRVNSVAEVLASAGETWFQDASDVVWVKFRGGRWTFWTTDPNVALPSSDDLLYEAMNLRIE